MSDGRRWYCENKEYEEVHSWCLSKIKSLDDSLKKSEKEIIRLKKQLAKLKNKRKNEKI